MWHNSCWFSFWIQIKIRYMFYPESKFYQQWSPEFCRSSKLQKSLWTKKLKLFTRYCCMRIKKTCHQFFFHAHCTICTMLHISLANLKILRILNLSKIDANRTKPNCNQLKACSGTEYIKTVIFILEQLCYNKGSLVKSTIWHH